jgi:hypothetical protein
MPLSQPFQQESNARINPRADTAATPKFTMRDMLNSRRVQ